MRLNSNIGFTTQQMKDVYTYIDNNPAQVLHIPAVLCRLALWRLESIDKDKDIQQHDVDSGAVNDLTIGHNLQGLRDGVALDRPKRLVNALTAVDWVYYHMNTAKVLSVGPRTEAELLYLSIAGFPLDNIDAIDLLSYSDLVELGDMHALPRLDNIYDIILLGWVLQYSTDHQQAANEVMRVAKAGAYVAVACRVNMYYKQFASSNPDEAVGGVLVETEDPNTKEFKSVYRYFNTGQILRLFDGRIHKVSVCIDLDPCSRQGDIIVVFRLK